MNPEELYIEAKPILYSMLHKFIRRYGGDFEELLSLCHLHFMEIVRKTRSPYQKEKGSQFTTWLRLVLWYKLQNDREKEILTSCKNLPPEEIGQKGKQEYLTDLKDSLSQEAKSVLSLILNTPEELVEMIQQKGGYNKRVKKCLEDFLCLHYHWSRRKVQRVFREIQENL